MEFYEPRKYKIFTFWREWMGVLCCLSIFQMFNQPSSDAQSVFFKFQLPHLWDFTPVFMMIYSCFYDDLLLLLWWITPAFMMKWFNIDWTTMDIALILFLPLIVTLSCREYEIFRPGKYLFPAERILCSIWEYTSFFTRMKCILVKNEVYSRKECSWFS